MELDTAGVHPVGVDVLLWEWPPSEARRTGPNWADDWAEVTLDTPLTLASVGRGSLQTHAKKRTPDDPVTIVVGGPTVVDACGTHMDCGPTPIRSGKVSISGLVPSNVGIQKEGDWTNCELRFIDTVWAFLKENWEILEWALCNARATSHTVYCMKEFLDGERNDIHFKLTRGCSGDYKMRTKSSGNVIKICADAGSLWDVAVQLFCKGGAEQQGEECAVLAVASSLAHELTHLCGGGRDPTKNKDADTYCVVSYLTGGYFAQGIFLQYKNASASDCCWPYLRVVPGTSSLPIPDIYCLASNGGLLGGGGNEGWEKYLQLVELPRGGRAVEDPSDTTLIVDGVEIQ